MSASGSVPKKQAGSFPERARVNRKILRFSVLIGIAGAFLTALAFFASAYPFLLRWKGINLRSLSEINCTDGGCDSSTLSADWELDGSDYVIDKLTGFFITAATPTAGGPGRFPPYGLF